jgi:hypothetical protein
MLIEPIPNLEPLVFAKAGMDRLPILAEARESMDFHNPRGRILV